MSLGKAAVYKHIPVYYPDRVGAVGGVVGLVGGLGGFVLPIAFGALNDLTGVWQSCFWLLFLIVSVSLVWMHFAIRQMEAEAATAGVPAARLPRVARDAADPRARHRKARSPATGAIQDWRPEDKEFWESQGPRHRPPQSVDLGALPAALVRGVDGVVGRRRASCRASASPSPTTSCSGSPRCRASPAPRCASSTASCRRSSADGCGRRWRPGRC